MEDLKKKLEEKKRVLKQLEANYNAVLGQISLLEDMIKESENGENN